MTEETQNNERKAEERKTLIRRWSVVGLGAVAATLVAAMTFGDDKIEGEEEGETLDDDVQDEPEVVVESTD